MDLKRSIAKAVLNYPAIARPIKRVIRSAWFTRQPAYQRWVMRQVARRDAEMEQYKPFVLIETILTCNARCIMCFQGHDPQRGEMSMDLYRKVIRDAADWGLPFVQLSGFGEPFADRHWLERIEIARAAGLEYELVSNASLLKPEIIRRMIELGGWRGIIFSINGFSTEVYERMMPPLKRERAYANVDMVLDLKRKMGSDRPRVSISCVETQVNIHERHQFLDYWHHKTGIDTVTIADCGTWIGELPNAEITFNGKRREVGQGSWLAPCRDIWSMMAVLYDGRVLPCCEAAGSRKLIVGDVNRNTLREVFHGPQLTALREMHRNNERGKHGICGKCQLCRPWSLV